MELFKKTWARVPLVGGLCQASPKTFGEAFKELAFVWTLSLLPVLLSSYIEAAHPTGGAGQNLSLTEALRNNVKAGEIFIYVNALLAPIGFILYKHNRDDAKFPNHIAFVWLLLIVIPLSTTIFALQRTGVISNARLIEKTAIIMFAIALLMRYTSLVYDSLRLDFVKTQKSQEDELIEKLKVRAHDKQ